MDFLIDFLLPISHSHILCGLHWLCFFSIQLFIIIDCFSDRFLILSIWFEMPTVIDLSYSTHSIALIDDRTPPYYLHHFGSPSFVLVSQVLIRDNYDSRSQAMQIALSVKNKIGFIDGSLGKPISSDPNYGVWMRNNKLVILCILNPFSNEISTCMMFTKTVIDICKDLQDRF